MAFTKAPISVVVTDANGNEVNLGQGSGPFTAGPTSIVITDKNGNAVTVGAGGGGGTGTVTSVDMTVPSFLAVSGNPITTAGTLAVVAATGQTANTVLATPNGSTGAASLRALVANDIPNLDAAKITTGTLALARGGTNADLSASGSATAVLAQDASHVVTARALVAADIPNLDASKITTGALAVARGGAASISGTGSAGFISAGISLQDQRPTATTGASVGNGLRVFKFILPYSISLSRITANVSSGNTAATTVTFGIYDNAGTTKLIDSGAISTASAGIITGTFGAVVLNPGAYWFAQSETSATPQFTALAAAATSWQAIVCGTNAYMGTAANAATAGVLPATLGVVTAANNVMVLAFWEP